MSEAPPEVTPEAADPTAPATDAPETTPPALGDAGKQAIDRMKAERDAARREARANSDAAKRLAELEESQKSKEQLIADRAAKAERERDDARTEGLRYKAAAKHGITEEDFDLLGSGDEEAIEARARRIGVLTAAVKENEQLRAQLEAATGKPVPSNGRPVEALKPGATPVPPSTPEDDSYPADFLPRRMRERMSGQT
jgi:hypothetical protein